MLKKTFSRMLLAIGIILAGGSASAENHKLSLLNLASHDALIKMGVWEHNILDADQKLRMEVIQGDSNVLKLFFDVDSPNPAMGGYWLDIEGQDLSGYAVLHLRMRVESDPQFSGNIGIQFTDQDNRKAPYILSGVRSEWKEFQIPLLKFKRIHDWSKVKAFEIIIDDIHARPKEGILFVKEIFLSKDGRV